MGITDNEASANSENRSMYVQVWTSLRSDFWSSRVMCKGSFSQEACSKPFLNSNPHSSLIAKGFSSTPLRQGARENLKGERRTKQNTKCNRSLYSGRNYPTGLWSVLNEMVENYLGETRLADACWGMFRPGVWWCRFLTVLEEIVEFPISKMSLTLLLIRCWCLKLQWASA